MSLHLIYDFARAREQNCERDPQFGVDQSVRLEAGDEEGVERLMQYFLRCPFSQTRMIEVTRLRRGFGGQADAGKVLYKTGDPPSPERASARQAIGWGDSPRRPATICSPVPSAMVSSL